MKNYKEFKKFKKYIEKLGFKFVYIKKDKENEAVIKSKLIKKDTENENRIK